MGGVQRKPQGRCGMSTLSYLLVTSGCMALIVTVGLLAAHVETTRREREMIRRPRQWRNGRVE